MSLTMKDIKLLNELEKKATTGPWMFEGNENDAPSGKNWFVCPSLGRSAEDNKFYSVTTDCVHASELDGDAKYDAQFIASMRNVFPSLLAQLEKMQEALKFCAFPYMHKPTPMEDVDARRFAAKSALIPEE